MVLENRAGIWTLDFDFGVPGFGFRTRLGYRATAQGLAGTVRAGLADHTTGGRRAYL